MSSTDFVVQNNMSVLCFLKSHFQFSLLHSPNEQQNARIDSGTILYTLKCLTQSVFLLMRDD